VSSELRSRLAAGCIDQALEYQKAIVVLTAHQLYGSAFALLRLIFESYVCGVWLHQRATEADLKRFVKGRLDKKFGVLLSEIEELEGCFNAGILSAVKKRSWPAMNSFTHSGFHQVGRRNTETSIEPNYSEEEILEALNFANAIGLLSAVEIARLTGNDILANEVLERTKREWSTAPLT
jgi:hypothetical protein